MPRTVVIVDDHAPFRASARKLLEVEGYEVVGEAGDAASAIEAVHTLRPEIVLLDVVLPDASGLDIADRLAETGAKVVLVSSRDRTDLGSRIRRTRAVGFIPKDQLSTETLAELL
jgi:DNA-binding NarL/FixJ family response regulator